MRRKINTFFYDSYLADTSVLEVWVDVELEPGLVGL